MEPGSPGWFWAHCPDCCRKRPLRLAPIIERWGADTSSDRFRQRLRCTGCGQRGAALHHPSWCGSSIGFEPYPEILDGTADV